MFKKNLSTPILPKKAVSSPAILNKISQNKSSDYDRDLTIKKASDSGSPTSSKTKSTLYAIVKRISSVLFSILGFLNPIAKMIEKHPRATSIILYIIRGLFALSVIGISIWSIFARPAVNVLYHLYSSLKSIFVILMIVSGIIIAVLTINAEKNRKKETRGTGETGETSDVLSVLHSLIELSPYMYDLIAFIILLGIIKAIYIRSCESNNPNVWGFISIIYWGPVAFIVLFILALIVIRLLGLVDLINTNDLDIFLNNIMSASVALLIFYFSLQYLEGLVANNISYWLRARDVSEEEDCVKDDVLGRDDGWEKVKNIMISIVLGTLLLLILIVQLIPYFGLSTVNQQARNAIKNAGKVFLCKLNILKENC
tara:strand:+ start:1355 stop:2464 length:1110 start_codon:yes stop_codon:yes gene_type:complete